MTPLLNLTEFQAINVVNNLVASIYIQHTQKQCFSGFDLICAVIYENTWKKVTFKAGFETVGMGITGSYQLKVVLAWWIIVKKNILFYKWFFWDF